MQGGVGAVDLAHASRAYQHDIDSFHGDSKGWD
jgi:hypothetical protein